MERACTASTRKGRRTSTRKEMEKQDCERKACWRLMEKIAEAFPRLPICLCGDSLYAGAKRKDAVEDRERGVQHAEEAGVPSGASVQ